MVFVIIFKNRIHIITDFQKIFSTIFVKIIYFYTIFRNNFQKP